MFMLFITGKQSQVLEIQCRRRIETADFILEDKPLAESHLGSCINNILKEAYPEMCIGLGGVFCATKGKIMTHVMPDLSKVM